MALWPPLVLTGVLAVVDSQGRSVRLRFGWVAAAALAVLALSGLVLAAGHTDPWPGASSGWEQTLWVKVGLVR